MTDNLKPCARCGQLADETRGVHVHGSIETWCRECIDLYAHQCERCGGEYAAYLQRVFHNNRPEEWCEDCVNSRAVECDCCGDLTAKNDCQIVSVYGIGGQTICNTCLHYYYQCAECGDWCTEDDAVYHDGEYYCRSCAPRDYIDSYHHTEAVSFLQAHPSDTAPYLGVELEMEFPTDDARSKAAEHIRTSTRYGHLYECKEDSSLNDYGLECVTQPATLLYHALGYDELMLSVDKLFGATSHDNGDCGLHVHIDRAFFNDTGYSRADYKAGYIMDTIFCNCEPYMVGFSRRTYSQLSRWAQMLNMHVCKEKKSFDAKMSEYSIAKYTRYQAVNMDNDETIELRLFRGTLNRETYFATLEFVTGLAYLTRALLPIPEYSELLTWADVKVEILAALESNGLPTEELNSYLTRRGL